MDSLLKQLRELPARLVALPAGLRMALIAGGVVAIALAVSVGVLARGGSDFQYAFTNLTQEDATEASGMLKTAGIPFRTEANGSALAVPADKVYDARILLATAGLPRGGGVGFELFDRGDLGVSEFTQRVNLRRAIEGELARTIGRLAGVRSAKLTVSLSEKGLYRDEDKKPSATVVVMLQPGRTLGERELAGIRHLVSSSVPGLPPDQVTVIDGRGAVLSSDSAWDGPEASYQRRLERDFEQRIVGLLEPVVGQGAVIARVTASVDATQVNQNSEVFDPDAVALRSERKVTQASSTQQTTQAGVAGAQANVPLQPAPAQAAPTSQGNQNNQDEVRNFEISKTTTTTLARLPRLQRLSVAIIIDGVEGKVREAAEVARLGELARKAVGYDEARGDAFEITSQVFGKSDVAEVVAEPAKLPAWAWGGVGLGAAALLAVGVLLLRRRSAPRQAELVLKPGQKVSELEARAAELDGTPRPVAELPAMEKPALTDPLADLKEKARAMVRADQERTLTLLRSWLSADLEQPAAQPQGVDRA
ncbi:MAG: flagellar M-ring protein FliF [Myxococcus sp.]|nr:flagellar M-ring protein FliF [Myxococcus sp.]